MTARSGGSTYTNVSHGDQTRNSSLYGITDPSSCKRDGPVPHRIADVGATDTPRAMSVVKCAYSMSGAEAVLWDQIAVAIGGMFWGRWRALRWRRPFRLARPRARAAAK